MYPFSCFPLIFQLLLLVSLLKRAVLMVFFLFRKQLNFCFMPVLDLAHGRKSVLFCSLVRYPSHWQMLSRASFPQAPGTCNNTYKHVSTSHCRRVQAPGPLHFSFLLSLELNKVKTPSGGIRSPQYIIRESNIFCRQLWFVSGI